MILGFSDHQWSLRVRANTVCIKNKLIQYGRNVCNEQKQNTSNLKVPIKKLGIEVRIVSVLDEDTRLNRSVASHHGLDSYDL